MYKYIQTIAQPWPHKNGIYLDDRYAIINPSKEGIEAIKMQLPK